MTVPAPRAAAGALAEGEAVADATVSGAWLEVFDVRRRSSNDARRFFFELDMRTNRSLHQAAVARGHLSFDPDLVNDTTAIFEAIHERIVRRWHESAPALPSLAGQQAERIDRWYAESFRASGLRTTNALGAAYEDFAAGDLRHDEVAISPVDPDYAADANSAAVFCFAEVGLAMHEYRGLSDVGPVLWDLRVVRSMIKMQDMFVARHGARHDYLSLYGLPTRRHLPGDERRRLDLAYDGVEPTVERLGVQMTANLRAAGPLGIATGGPDAFFLTDSSHARSR